MSGTLVIIAGIISCFVGVGLLMAGRKKRPPNNLEKPPTKAEYSSVSLETEAIASKKEELLEYIKLAAADGFISANENEIIYNKALQLGVDIDLLKGYLAEELKKNTDNYEVREIDQEKEKGNIFEGYVASKFSKDYFVLKDWTGDKFDKGIFAESVHNPDLRIQFKFRDQEQEFAVECKYRSNFYKDGIKWAQDDDQIERYKKYEQENKIPVFIVIGVGGEPNNPENLFVIPLKDIKHIYITAERLMGYKKRNFQSKGFYFDPNSFRLT